MSKKTSRSPASRANVTRNARRAFVNHYGELTATVVRMLSAGVTVPEIRKICRVSPRSIAAFRANWTRGAYRPYVTVNGGTCRF